MSRTFLIALRYALLLSAILLLLTIILQTDTRFLWKTLKEISGLWLGLGLLCILANFGCAAKRLQALIAPELSYIAVFEAVMAAFLLNYASMIQGLGIGAKIGLMKIHQVPVSRSMAGIASEITLDLLFTGCVAIAFVLATRAIPWAALDIGSYAMLVWAGAILVAIVGIVLLHRRDFFLRLR